MNIYPVENSYSFYPVNGFNYNHYIYDTEEHVIITASSFAQTCSSLAKYYNLNNTIGKGESISCDVLMVCEHLPRYVVFTCEQKLDTSGLRQTVKISFQKGAIFDLDIFEQNTYSYFQNSKIIDLFDIDDSLCAYDVGEVRLMLENKNNSTDIFVQCFLPQWIENLAS